MARRAEVGTLGLGILSAALVAGYILPAHADDKKLALSATTTFTTDYVFRGISQTNQNPAAQAEFDATYGIFYAGMWGSNVDFGESLEIDYYAGITPTWNGISFDIAALEYTYPGASDLDLFELKTGASYTFMDALTLGITNYWGIDGKYDVMEWSGEYAFSGKLFNFFSPSVSGLFGTQWADSGGTDYSYWNAGLTLGFLDHWSADIRYWDSDLSAASCGDFTAHNCDSRIVGSVTASF
jgi:uncharacterized protein (TIGR02001 family)